MPSGPAGPDGMAAQPTGLMLASGVLGAGLLLSPPITAGLAGSLAVLAWVAHLVTGGLFSFGIGLLARKIGPVDGLADLAGRTWGRLGANGVVSLYAAGFVAGQAAITLAAGGLAAYAIGRPSWSTGLAVAAVAVAAVVAILARQVPDRLRRWRAWLTLPIGFAVAADPGLLRGSGLLPSPGEREFWVAVFLLLFAGVGWEQSARLAGGVRTTRRLVRVVVTGGLVVAACYLLVGGTASFGQAAAWPASVSAGLGGLAAVVLVSYCVTNLQAVAGFLAVLLPQQPSGRAVRVAGTAAVVAAILLVCGALGGRVFQLLGGPAVATWLIYTQALCSGLRLRDRSLRLALAIPLALLAVTALAAGWSLIA